MQKNDLCVLGVGNILEKDDGVAVYATSYLKQNYLFEPEIDIVNGGVEGINLLNLFMEYKHILILDAIEIEDEPGSIYHIPSHELTGMGLNSGGAHEVGVLQCIDMLELMDKPLPKSSVVGIIPDTVEVHIGLTSVLAQRFPDYIETIIRILKENDIHIEKREETVTLEQVIADFADPRPDRS